MTPDELSRLIAESIEPKPKTGDHVSYGIFDPTEPTVPGIYGGPIPKYRRSLKKAWRQHITVNDTVDLYMWEHVDFVTDPAMTLMLLEKIVVKRGFIQLSAWLESPTRVSITGQMDSGYWKSDEPSTYAATESIGESVALTYARMEGLLK